MAHTTISAPSASAGFVCYIENKTLYIASAGYKAETITVAGAIYRVCNNTSKAIKCSGELNFIIFPQEIIAAELFPAEHSFTLYPCVDMQFATSLA